MKRKIKLLLVSTLVVTGLVFVIGFNISLERSDTIDINSVKNLDGKFIVSTDSIKSLDSTEIILNSAGSEKDSFNERPFTNVEIKNSEVNPYPDSPAITGLTSMYPDSPVDVYFENIQYAKDGSDTAQYLVARSLKECMGIADQAAIQEYTNLNMLSEKDVMQLQAHHDRCEGLANVISAKELNSFGLHYEWLSKAHQNGNQQAAALIYQLHPERDSRSEALEIITNSFVTRSESDYIPHDALISFIANNVEDGQLTAAGLEIAICMNLDWCDEVAKIAYAEYYEKKIDADTIKEKAQTLSKLIADNDIDGILQFTDVYSQQ